MLSIIANHNSKRRGTPLRTSMGLIALSLVCTFGEASATTQKNAKKSADTTPALSWALQSIAARSAWDGMKTRCGVNAPVVAVIDTGVDFSHPALQASAWTNLKELRGKPNVDDDRNGFVDDIHGFDFASNSGKIVDNHGHGTHIAGIITAKSTESGSSGVCPGVKIMSLRYYDPNASGSDNLKNTIRAIHYAVDSGVDIINYSGGGAEFSREEFNALKRAQSKGILVVAAAGNERSNADAQLYFPSAYALQNIVSVTAINQEGQLLSSSNWGTERVHMAAPGQSIVSTLPRGGFGAMTGTSQATAFVTGVAAMLLTENPKLKFSQLKTLLETSVERSAKLLGKTKTAGVVNAKNALANLKRQDLGRGSRGLSSSKGDSK